MGFFSNDNDRPRNPDAVFGFRALAAAYVLYLVYQVVQMYLDGEATSSVWVLVAAAALAAAAIFILVSSWLSWKKEKAALKEQEETPETEENTDE